MWRPISQGRCEWSDDKCRFVPMDTWWWLNDDLQWMSTPSMKLPATNWLMIPEPLMVNLWPPCSHMELLFRGYLPSKTSSSLRIQCDPLPTQSLCPRGRPYLLKMITGAATVLIPTVIIICILNSFFSSILTYEMISLVSSLMMGPWFCTLSSPGFLPFWFCVDHLLWFLQLTLSCGEIQAQHIKGGGVRRGAQQGLVTHIPHPGSSPHFCPTIYSLTTGQLLTFSVPQFPHG